MQLSTCPGGAATFSSPSQAGYALHHDLFHMTGLVHPHQEAALQGQTAGNFEDAMGIHQELGREMADRLLNLFHAPEPRIPRRVCLKMGLLHPFTP